MKLGDRVIFVREEGYPDFTNKIGTVVQTGGMYINVIFDYNGGDFPCKKDEIMLWGEK